MATRLPNVLWAQDKDKVFFTIDVQEAERPKVTVDNNSGGNGSVIFRQSYRFYCDDVTVWRCTSPCTSSRRGKAKSHAVGPENYDYELDLELFAAVSPEDSKISVTARCVFLLIAKKNTDEEYWPRLTKSKDKQANVKVDWDKWVDEDEEEPQKDPASQFDLSSLGDLSNFSGAGLNDTVDAAGGNDDDDDTDDEELPELESA